jgi:hypothetical protein
VLKLEISSMTDTLENYKNNTGGKIVELAMLTLYKRSDGTREGRASLSPDMA